MSVIKIKLEMAEMSIKANRINEAEKIIMEIILDSSADNDSLYSAWLALGSIKMIKLLKKEVIFIEVEYCFKKAYDIKPDELTIEAYLIVLKYILTSANAAIEISNDGIKRLQTKATLDLLITIGSALVLNERNNSLLTNVVGLIGLDYGVSGIVGDVNTLDGFNDLIIYLNKLKEEVYISYNRSGILNENQVVYFEELKKEIEFGPLEPQVEKNKIDLFLDLLEENASNKSNTLFGEIDFKKGNSFKELASNSNSFNAIKAALKNHIELDDRYMYFLHRKGFEEVRTLFTTKHIYIISFSGFFKTNLDLTVLDYQELNSTNIIIQPFGQSKNDGSDYGQKIVFIDKNDCSFVLIQNELFIDNDGKKREFINKIYNSLISLND